ncbi:hypothetical protein PO909_014051 [Leuciscus waleckii]
MSRHICGGSIISHRNNYKLQVVAGVNSRSKREKGVQYRSVQQVILHEKFNRSYFENDVALLRLHRSLYFTNHVQPLCMIENEMDEKQLSFGSCYITGWGSSVLQGMLVDTLQEAERSWYNGHVNDNMICAGFDKGGVDTW